MWLIDSTICKNNNTKLVQTPSPYPIITHAGGRRGWGGEGGSSDMHYTIVVYKFCDQVQFTHVQLQNHFGLNFLIRKQTQFSWMSQQWVGVRVSKVKKRVGGLFWVTVLWCINNDNNETAFMHPPHPPHFPTSAVVLQHKSINVFVTANGGTLLILSDK